MAKGDHFYELSYPDPFPNLFEAGNDDERAYEEARPLARCEFPRNVTPSRRHPSGEASCEMPAIAKLCYSGSGSGEMPVCHEHLEKVKKQARRRGECICEWREPNPDEGEYDWQRVENPDCPINHEGGE